MADNGLYAMAANPTYTMPSAPPSYNMPTAEPNAYAPPVPPRFTQNPFDLSFLQHLGVGRSGEGRLPGSMFNLNGYFDRQMGKDVPLYGGALQIPNSNMSLIGQYQTAPERPDNYGVALRYRKQF